MPGRAYLELCAAAAKMKDNVVNIYNDTKPGTIPDFLKQMKDSDITIVIHVKKGVWTMQHLKGETPIWTLMGLLECIITHFANAVNGVEKL